MPLKLISAGGGSLTITPTSTASNYTLTVPAITGELVTTDSNGNVGLGVSPSAWSIGKALQIGSSGDSSILGYNNASYLLSNAYYNGGWKYTAAGKAAFQYFQNGATGYAQWSSAPVGTNAGDAITFTTLMTLNNAGYLGIGTTSPAACLSLSNQISSPLSGTSQPYGVHIYPTSTGACYIDAITSSTSNAGPNLRAYNNTVYTTIIGTQDGGNTTTFATSGNERMRIDTSGNLGIGTVSPSQKLHLASAASAGNIYALIDSSLTANGYNAATLYKNDQRMFRVGVLGTVGGFTNGALVVYDETAAAWRMVIDSSGSLIIGDTGISAGNERVRIKSNGSTSSTAGIQIINFAGTELFFVRSDGAFRTGSASVSPYNNTVGSGANLFVNTDGTLLRSTSSLKYKTDVNDATHGLADVMNLRSVTYKGKNNEVDGDNIYGGLIAEEVHEAGLTEFIQYAEDGTPDGIYYGNMVGLLVKAIQELTERVKILESK